MNGLNQFSGCYSPRGAFRNQFPMPRGTKNDSVCFTMSTKITHYSMGKGCHPVPNDMYRQACGHQPIAIVHGVINGTTLQGDNLSDGMPAELMHKLRPTRKAYYLLKDYTAVLYTKRNTQMESYITPYMAFGMVYREGDIGLIFTPPSEDSLVLEMVKPYDGCIVGMYLSTTHIPGRINAHGILIPPDSELLKKDVSTLLSMGVVKGLMKHTPCAANTGYHWTYTIYMPDIADPFSYAKTFRTM